MQVVWFKRDLRIVDHAALYQATQQGSVLPLYILEPELWQQDDLSYRHYQFLLQCLDELTQNFKTIEGSLIIKVGNALEILRALHRSYDITALWSHQETWNHWTYQRDLSIQQWTKKWHRVMEQLRLETPEIGHNNRQFIVESDPLPSAESLNLSDDYCHYAQLGGRSAGLTALHSFLHQRGEHYTKEMSSPLTAFDSCSRLSPYLAFGVLSLREVYQACLKRQTDVEHIPSQHRGRWPNALRSFLGRLHWHCHFIQKLEDDPRIEWQNMHPAYNHLRSSHTEQDIQRLNAWKTGYTGFPMIDACMRALIATGWINFRMRAMLMSFASYHLWLDWHEPALHLARLFIDYEPGIHYSQVQMQSGTTGMNALRVYNPIKQGLEQDPEGIFIRRWLPELVDIPSLFIHTPWVAPQFLNDYPLPIVDEQAARKQATDCLYPSPFKFWGC